jgi:hypothetical protein
MTPFMAAAWGSRVQKSLIKATRRAWLVIADDIAATKANVSRSSGRVPIVNTGIDVAAATRIGCESVCVPYVSIDNVRVTLNEPGF